MRDFRRSWKINWQVQEPIRDEQNPINPLLLCQKVKSSANKYTKDILWYMYVHNYMQSPSIASRLRHNRTAAPYTSAPKHNYSAWKMTSFSTSSTRVQCAHVAHVAKYSSHAFWLVIVRVVANTETGTVGGIAGIAGNLGNLLRLLYPYAKKSTRKFDYDWFSPGIFTQNLNQTIV